jgi:hypothetical protein
MINKKINKITDKPQFYKISTIFMNNKTNQKINRFHNNNIAKVLKINQNLIKIRNNKNHNNNNNNKNHSNNNNYNNNNINSNRYNNNY